jgi:hypothetical protein
MNILLQDRKVRRNEIAELIKGKSEREILDIFFDFEFRDNRYYICDHWRDSHKTTRLERFNHLWVWPLFILCIPFLFVINGEPGINPRSRVGKIITKLLGDQS